MYRIDDPSASATLPTPEAALTEGYWTEGNPGTGTPATLERASWFNMIQEELRAIAVAGGLTPSKTTYNQVLLAIKRLVQNQAVLTDTGAVNAYAAANTPPLVTATWSNGTTQQIVVAHTNTGASTYSPDALTAIPIYGLGLRPLQQGEMFAGGTAILMKQTIAGVNSGNPIAVLLECAGGAQQVAPATASQHAVQLGQVAGVVGSVRNLVMSVTAASATATLTADEIIVETALGGVRYCLPSFSKTINLATTGAGGMDTGTAPVSGFVALYAIWNPTTSTAALLATNATSSLVGNVYGGANMPSGYTASALVSVRQTNASSQFVVGNQRDRRISAPQQAAVLTSTSTGGYTAQGITGNVPRNAVSYSGTAQISTTNNGTINIYVAEDANGSGVQNIFFGTPASTTSNLSVSYRDVLITTPGTMYYNVQVSGGGTVSAQINTTGYSI
ncbi:hypothetical protein R69746_05674 [Paraburkholderia aspalathi]|uniref:hypothetical protein n=1 Tax=Paraburkholderia aspalathi TaxID=1324617 RepID=UPI0019099B4A|nr:hypothetical protein [Paraburkholderia aspalathi]MBK3841704.1 hypothetical protein [Paraburkholderia aspalathi]CAE6812167.1 hypothetical protein R69746_05674 [Paraburkholderia aspalathi]